MRRVCNNVIPTWLPCPSNSDVRRIQTSFPLIVFVSVVDLPENTFLFASAVGAPCEGFLGLTSGFAKIALRDEMICSKIYLELPGLDFPVLTKDVSSYGIKKS